MPVEKFSSGALEVNLANTRRDDIVIPPEQQDFIDYSAEYWGIQQRTREFFVELNHPYANHRFLVEEYRKIILGDRWLYDSLDEAGKAFGLLLDIASGLLHQPLDEKDKSGLLRTLLEFAGACCRDETTQDEAVGRQLLQLFHKVFVESPMLLVRISGGVKKHLKPLATDERFSEDVLQLAIRVAAHNLEFWKKNTHAGGWFQKKQKLFSKDYSHLVREMDSGWFFHWEEKLEKTKTWDALQSDIPMYQEVGAHFFDLIGRFEKNIDRFYYIIFLLQHPGMENQQPQLLWELNKMLRNIHNELQGDALMEFISNIFAMFRELKKTHMSTVLDCVLTLGKEVIQVKERRIISFFENELIGLGFVAPGRVYIQDNWQLSVDPNHVKNIRVWLELIEHAPYTFRKLLSALIVSLRMGGIFIFDTDLFQRDITKLLNSDISPLYKQIKQLTRLFPVYFNEIGAEGELREVTTMMDEISGRQDKLIHFLRKQVHIEGNNSHIILTRNIFLFWYDSDASRLKKVVPPDVFQTINTGSRWFKGVNKLLTAMCRQRHCGPSDLLHLKESDFYSLLESRKEGCENDRKRLRYLFRLYFLLSEKYSFEATDIGSNLRKYTFFSEEEVKRLTTSLKDEKTEQSLELIYEFMERLNQVIFNPEISEGWESIYHKRHIAFGIPSMYGQYRETKFEALGLIFRLERLASNLMEQRIYEFKAETITARSLKECYSILALFRKGLELDGVTSQGFDSNLQMLRYGLTSESFSLHQFINLFQFMARNVKEITHTYFFGFYDQPLRMIIPQLYDADGNCSEKELNRLILERSENFYRETLSSSFLIQLLDNFISRVMHSMRNMVDNLTPEVIRHIMSYDPELVVSPLYEETLKLDNQIFLGSKAYFQKKLYLSGFPVPPGYVITTEVFRRRRAITSSPSLSEEVDKQIKDQLCRLEKVSGRTYGNPRNPLLLSVRSGTAISMPGAMNTYLNVGMNDRFVEILSRQPNFGWTSWDCYRRLLQSWGMTYGIDRDVFDQVMIDFKNTYRVELKVQFTPEQMREMAYAYKEILKKHQVHFEEDPWKQLRQAIMSVFDSWSSERAQVYRNHLQIADLWGTAVVIQQMVLGNVYEYSGTGVAFTHNPQVPKPGIYLNGDFTLCSQGEDIVAGLVHALPVSNLQKELSGREKQTSLQEQLPAIYERLYQIAHDLVEKHGYNHQEIEFTFESDRPEDLYILQVRDQDTRKAERITVFSKEAEDMQLLARGIGGGGGALSGRLAIDMSDIMALRENYPNDPCILMRPDTVPDDIPMIFECDGLVTSRGGTTSHAAVTAARLGKVCVLNCIPLVVDEKEKLCHINGQTFRPGDAIAIDGFAGNIYRGNYPTGQTEIISLLI
jgi:pyruvate, orthophosphate dikinase